MNSFAPVPSEDDCNGSTNNYWNDLERDIVMDKKCESAILEEDASSDNENGNFENYSHDSYDNDISHDNNSKELYGKAQNVMSEKSNFFYKWFLQ